MTDVSFLPGRSSNLRRLRAQPVAMLCAFMAICFAAAPASGQNSPVITSFSATPPTIRSGQSSTLSWTTQGATSVSIDQGIGAQPAATKTTSVSPGSTTTYTLTAGNAAGKTTATAKVTVLTEPSVVVGAFPAAMMRAVGSSASTVYTLTNVGGSATTITLSQTGNFFTQAPSTFSLPPGGSQTIRITAGSLLSAGSYLGASIPVGNGVAAGLQIPVKLLVTTMTFFFVPNPNPVDSPQADPLENRIDVGAAASGLVRFANIGGGELNGLLTSDSPWLIPQIGTVTIPVGAAASIPFRIDRSQRPDASAPTGSATGTISLTYLGQSTTGAPPVSSVTVVDTVPITTTSAKPPALTAGEIALFLPGLGRTLGSGTSVSDLALLNALGSKSINDLRLYFTPAGGSTASQLASFPALRDVPITVADIVRKVFNSGQVGSLQVRSADASNVLVTANAVNASGGFGTAIPAFRSDRAVASGGRLFLTGLRDDATTHTDLFIQETAGTGVNVHTEFLAADGGRLSMRDDQVGAFALAQIPNALPPGTVSAILTGSGSGSFLAYATPVDEQSGDSWSVVDWSRQYGYAADDPVVIPVGGANLGRNNEYFRTEIALMNTGANTAAGSLRFISEAGTTFDSQVISLEPRQSIILSNVLPIVFAIADNVIGNFVFKPSAGSFAVTSRVFAVYPGKPGTYSAGVPVIALSKALRVGAVRAIGSLEDATLDTVAAARPATFRTGFGIAEVSGNPVQVRVTLRYSFSGSTTTASGSWSKDYSMAPNQFIRYSSITREILGSGRDALDDLRNVEADFQVVSGSGAVMFYTWSIDNGTGDSSIQVAASTNANDPTALCAPSPRIACMLNNRIKATMRYRGAFDSNPVDTDALVRPVTGFASQSYETAFFYFNSPNNIEVLLKLLDQGNADAQGNPTFAVLFGTATPLRTELTITDTQTGVVRPYSSDFGSMKGGTDFTAFIKSRLPWPSPLALSGLSDEWAESPPREASGTASPARAAGPLASACVADAQTACLLNGRFTATVRYRKVFDNLAVDTNAFVKTVTGFGSANYETAFFYFNNPNNIELLLKVLDQGNADTRGRPTIAVLYGSATPLRIELTITDTKTSISQKYTSQFGTQAGNQDFTAFVK